MTLRDLMGAETQDLSPDTDRLVRTATREGGRIRRRRHTITALGAAAAVVVAGTVGWVGLRGPDGDGDRVADRPSATSSSIKPLARLDGRTTVAMLRAFTAEQVDGESSTYEGQEGPGRDTYGSFRLRPAGGGGEGLVEVNVQGGSILGDLGPGCESFMNECTSRRVAGGDTLVTYRDASETGRDIRLVADLRSPDRSLRVVAASTNGFSQGNNGWDITRETPVLAVGDLTAVVTRPEWGFRVPREYAAAGKELRGYRDVDTFMAPRSQPSPPSAAPRQ